MAYSPGCMATIPCFECGKAADHNHHIVPKSLGGTRTVPLCVGCHSKVHGRQLVHNELIKAGQARAKAEGKTWGGRKVGIRITVTPEKEGRVKEMYEAGVSISEIHRVTGLSRQSIYRVLGLWERKPKAVAE